GAGELQQVATADGDRMLSHDELLPVVGRARPIVGSRQGRRAVEIPRTCARTLLCPRGPDSTGWGRAPRLYPRRPMAVNPVRFGARSLGLGAVPGGWPRSRRPATVNEAPKAGGEISGAPRRALLPRAFYFTS